MKRMMKIQYDFQEVCKREMANVTDIEYRWYLIFAVKFADRIKIILNELTTGVYGLAPELIKFADWDSENNTYIYKDYVEEMLNDFYPRFYKYYAVEVEDETTQAFSDAATEFFYKFWNVLNVTYPKYAPIIKSFKDNEAKLMASLNRDYTDDADSSGTVTSRFNDTPQDGGLFEDDAHTTNVNETSSSSDSGLEHKEEFNNEYMIDRINKIRDNLSNLFTEWENKVATILWR